MNNEQATSARKKQGTTKTMDNRSWIGKLGDIGTNVPMCPSRPLVAIRFLLACAQDKLQQKLNSNKTAGQ